ncbi:non-ribosomal peptide synthetase, partial [Streptomyces laculatispora]|uniref:non-ribosomal peptide synthetase n=1 Tax=Streptomyces laculatispora TaxID=887464 RepID=UPI001A950D6C
VRRSRTDAAWPAERLARVAEAAHVRALVVDEAAADQSWVQETAADLPLIVVDALGGILRGAPARPGPLPCPTRGDRLAYVMFTSGSTGLPKGVGVTHADVLALAADSTWKDGVCEAVLLHSAYVFDASTFEIWVPLLSGGRVVVAPGGVVEARVLHDMVNRQGVTALFLTTALFNVVAEADPTAFAGLRMVAAGGEAATPDLMQRVAAAAPATLVLHVYGPTETTTFTARHPVDAGAAGVPPIGRALDGMSLYVLDDSLGMVPPGVVGELYVSGHGVARGYQGSPAPTATRFVADPYDTRGGRMYRTGDLVHRDDSGSTYYLGRGDEQVKLRGLRIEPGEIAAALVEHPGVERAVAVVRHDRGTAQLVAYVVPAQGVETDEDALLLHAAERLPAAMVPAAVVVLDALPLSSHGKLDRTALPAPAERTGDTVRLPGSAREAVLCGLFAELLDVEQAGADDDFFRLGGDSIMAIQLAARARAAGLVLSPHDVFTARTPARLAVLARTPGTDAPAEEDTGSGRLPLTPVMHWWREQVRDTSAFTQSMLFPLAPGTGLAAIEEAVAALTERHAALRMRLVRDGDTGWELEVPAERAPAGARAVRLAVAADADLHSRATELARTATLRPEDGEMVRAVWLDPGPARPGALVLTVHHLAVDGFSWRVLGQELAAALDPRPEDEAAPAGTASFTRWSRLLSREAGLRIDELPWWERQLADSAARLTGDREAGGRRETLTFELGPELTRSVLVTLPADFNCRPDAVMLTALTAAAVQRRGTGSALLVHLEGHGREVVSTQVDVSGTVGWFTTQYPVRLDIGAASMEPGGHPGEALKCVKEQLRAVPSGGLGWGLLRYLHPETGPALAVLPAPDVRFNYLGRFTATDAAGGRLLDLGPDAVPLAHTLEVDVLAREENGEPLLEASFSYPSGVFTEDEVGALAAAWSQALGVLADHCGPDGGAVHTPSDFPLVDLTGDQLELLALDMDFDDPDDGLDGIGPARHEDEHEDEDEDEDEGERR